MRSVEDRQIKARLREVERRYKRNRPKFSRENLRRGEQFKLYRGRLGPSAREVDILAAIDDAMQCAPMDVDDTEAGKRVGLTLAERVKYGIRTMNACDVTAAEQDASYAKRRRQQNRDATKRWRLRQGETRKVVVVMSRTDLHREKVRSVLRSKSNENPDHWSTIGDLADAVAKSRAFAGLKSDNIRRAINRALDCLTEDIEQTILRGLHSFPTRLVRCSRKAASGVLTRLVPEDRTA